MRLLRVFMSLVVVLFVASAASAVPLTFASLTGLAGGAPAETSVFKADLSGIGLASVLSLSILDNSAGLGGSPGQFSGFDLDAIKFSTTDCADAACASSAAAFGVFDFTTAGTTFTPGAQRAPADAKLFGTGPLGNTLDDAVARLGLFDGNSTVAIPGADGFISLGDGGQILFSLTSALSTSGLFLYIGEVGNNGELAAGSITVSGAGDPVPEPATLTLLGLGLSAAAFERRRRRRA